MKKNSSKVLIAASVNALLTLLYAAAILLMILQPTFKIGEGDDALIINFIQPTPLRIFNWVLLFAVSLFITVSLYSKLFKNKYIKVITTLLTIVFSVLELITFLGPFIKKQMEYKSFYWDFLLTFNLVIFLLRAFVTIVCIISVYKTFLKKNRAK